ncbi:MAG: UDP-N-acetylglucosamine 4,6-dehydratase (inverting) [Candidatus Pacebacteria bacterium]|nr:UDP-N-acetylglucosamine 4,6-dehydratase (inverting) [Candidatus Paceibacterota bacterium]
MIPTDKNYSLNGKTILLTGGTGSFGQKFTEIALKECNPHSIRIFDNRELAAVEMERDFRDPRLRFFMGDVRDKKRLLRAMKGADIVVHAAALKHVPICEYNPIEAVKTNIEGSINIIDAAIDSGVEKVMAISTDKAVHPCNLYGATKMVAEKLFVQGNSYSGGKNPYFSCCRYGNVIGSSGSVVPLFFEQKSNGEITITDERMTRFWVTLNEGVRFVINSIEIMKGGEIFIPKIPSMKVMELADVIAPEAKKKIIGIRSGEKLHEVLLTEEEALHTKEFDKFFIITPQYPFWHKDNFKEGRNLPFGFRYSSDNNGEWIVKDQIKAILKINAEEERKSLPPVKVEG